MGQHSGWTVWEESQALQGGRVESYNVRYEVLGLPAVQDNVVYSFIDWGQCDVVIQKLTKLHQHQGVARVQIGHISVDYNGD